MTRDEQVAAIERDRQRREDALALLLLALADRARVNVNRSIRVGADWRLALSGTLLGNAALDLPGGVNPVAVIMADSHVAGAVRVGRLVEVKIDPPSTSLLLPLYRQRAFEILTRVRDGIERNVSDALADAATADRITADVAAVGEAFRAAGFAEDASAAAEAEASGAVTSAYASGTAEGYGSDAVAAVTTGLRFVTVKDERRTEICKAREGVTLPLDDNYWFRSFPPCHFGCRSVVLPLTGSGVKFTENPPEYPPPDPGWGRWAGFLSAFRQPIGA